MLFHVLRFFPSLKNAYANTYIYSAYGVIRSTGIVERRVEMSSYKIAGVNNSVFMLSGERGK